MCADSISAFCSFSAGNVARPAIEILCAALALPLLLKKPGILLSGHFSSSLAPRMAIN
jgi:hypothetical protein